MKKNDLWVGLVYLLVGLAFLGAALWGEFRLEGLFWGFAGAGIVPGLTMIVRYFYWKNPQNAPRYQERLEAEKIEARDELKVMLRDKSGRYAYLLGLGILSLSIVIFSVLGALDIIESRLIVIYLGCYLLFQFIIGVLIFNQLQKRY